MTMRPVVLAFAVAAAACGSSESPPGVAGPTPVATPTPTPIPDPSARYRVTLSGLWSAATHPDRIPPNPHFSPLVGATHGPDVRFWAPGEIASDGIERMAEEGRTTPLDEIIRAAIDAGTADQLLLGGGISRSPGEVSIEVDVFRDFSRVTLVSMLAPSPDWFVGISARDLLETGAWPDELAIELFPYDAGTDSGDIYTAPDSDTVPREPISRIEGAPFASGGRVAPVAMLTFARLTG